MGLSQYTCVSAAFASTAVADRTVHRTVANLGLVVLAPQGDRPSRVTLAAHTAALVKTLEQMSHQTSQCATLHTRAHTRALEWHAHRSAAIKSTLAQLHTYMPLQNDTITVTL